MNRRRGDLLAYAAALGGVSASWSITEVWLAPAAEHRGLPATLLVIAWVLAYAAGHQASRRLLSPPGAWRAPFLLAGLLLLATAWASLGASEVELLAAYTASALSMGMLSHSTMNTVVNTLESHAWRRGLFLLRSGSGVFYAGLAGASYLASNLAGPYVVPGLLALAGLLSLAAAARTRRPALPETALAQLDISIEGIVFGTGPGGLASLWGLGVLASAGVALRVYTAMQSASMLGLHKAMAVYALGYLAGSMAGSLWPSPGLAGLLGIAAAGSGWALGPGASSLLVAATYSALAETSAVLYGLMVEPVALPRLSSRIVWGMVASVAAAGAAVTAGVGHQAVVAGLVVAGLAGVSRRRRSWY